MDTVKSKITFSERAEKEFLKTEKALQKVSENISAEAKATNTYIVVSDKKGGVKKIPAKDL